METSRVFLFSTSVARATPSRRAGGRTPRIGACRVPPSGGGFFLRGAENGIRPPSTETVLPARRRATHPRKRFFQLSKLALKGGLFVTPESRELPYLQCQFMLTAHGVGAIMASSSGSN